ncbi:ABC transporter permease [Prosthecochloris sp. HL-130-GSB]|jgi:ABC-type nitrate/sulfonate/bicarbonate transport system permease component|uniref:ABC transporter permease n=1 Tax=Prosthecochloris sp. HL-130-GSB TaxID=1974213 RepID=UPI000A1BFF0B|nr:ABC transporter permease [Prosthecochloris sp. HL-130-GSB]ARM30166.1 ABC transporter permease [Prosthecochloris sp. HL-130-GSB]MBO8091758.1 ABC transporter permease [Prosthecochloris sp.]
MPGILNISGTPSARKKTVMSVASIALILLLWHAVSAVVYLQRGVEFPGPVSTLLRLVELIQGHELSGSTIMEHTRASIQRWFTGITIAAALGIGWGVIAGRSPVIESLTSRIPQLLLLIPGLAWIPVALLLFGIGELSTIFMISVSAFAPIAVNTLSGIKHVDINLVRAAQMMGAGTSTLFFNVLLPAALPALLTGMRIGIGTGWRVLVAAEMIVGTGTGLGYSIIQARWTLDYASSFACIAIICLIGLLVEHTLLKQLEKRTIERWNLAASDQ